MVSHLDSKDSNYTSSTVSNGTSEHTLSSSSYMEDPLGLALMNGQQLIDDLAIIDDLYDIYGQEVDCFGKWKESVCIAVIVAHFGLTCYRWGSSGTGGAECSQQT